MFDGCTDCCGFCAINTLEQSVDSIESVNSTQDAEISGLADRITTLESTSGGQVDNSEQYQLFSSQTRFGKQLATGLTISTGSASTNTFYTYNVSNGKSLYYDTSNRVLKECRNGIATKSGTISTKYYYYNAGDVAKTLLSEVFVGRKVSGTANIMHVFAYNRQNDPVVFRISFSRSGSKISSVDSVAVYHYNGMTYSSGDTVWFYSAVALGNDEPVVLIDETATPNPVPSTYKKIVDL